MNTALGVTRMRLERLGDERERTRSKIGDIIEAAEEEQRDLGEFENEQLAKYRTRLQELEDEISVLASDLERAQESKDLSKLLRSSEQRTESTVTLGGSEDGPIIYRTFAAYARDELISRYPLIAGAAAGNPAGANQAHEEAVERLQRVQNTLTSNVAGLLPPTHMSEIMDIIDGRRPVVATGRHVPLTSGQLTYPKIDQRPSVAKQSAEKTEGGTANMQISMQTLNAETYIGGGDLSWQTINWTTPDALALWFQLAAEAYARQTEIAACAELVASAIGTITTPLGTTGTETFAQWRTAAISGIGSVYNTTAGRAQTDTLYLSAQRFFQLAGLGTDQVLQVSSVGSLDVGSMRGTWAGLNVVGSYGFANANTAIIGDASAFLVAETPGAPVEMRAVEPAIGGMEVGIIGAFKSKVFDVNRFIRLS